MSPQAAPVGSLGSQRRDEMSKDNALSTGPGPANPCSVDLSIVVVSWNVRELLEQCLQSLLRGASWDAPGVWRTLAGDRRFEVLVVDSASTDGSPDMVRDRFPEVRLYASDENLGYTGGNNLGLKESLGRYALLLNPDTEVINGALDQMVTYLEEHADVGVVGPQLLYPDGRIQSSRRRFPSLATALVDSTFLEKWFPKHPTIRHYRVLDRPDDEVSEVDWLVGACLLVRRRVVEEVGLLDEEYFMYSEELDWQRRIRNAGWKVVYLPQAQVLHYEGKSSAQVGALTHIRFSRSKVRYFQKYHGPLVGELVRLWLLLHYAYEWTVETAKWCVGHKRGLRRQRMRAYGQVLRSRLVVRT